MPCLPSLPRLKLRQRGLIVLIMLLTAPPAMAEENCQLQTTPSSIDFGNTTRAELLNRQVSPLAMLLGKQSVLLSIVCKTPVHMRLRFHGQPASAERYALDTGGDFSLRLSDARLDGRSVVLKTLPDNGDPPPASADSAVLSPQAAVTPMEKQQAATGRHLQLQVDVEARISTLGSRVPDRTTFRANGYFTLQEN